jgi:hypothetical protein
VWRFLLQHEKHLLGLAALAIEEEDDEMESNTEEGLQEQTRVEVSLRSSSDLQLLDTLQVTNRSCVQ